MIDVNELTKRYGSRTVLDRLSFSVRPGFVTGFLGPNGAGKSTTLKLLLGLVKPTGGTATIDGHRFGDRPRGLRHVGALLDANDVHSGLSASAHLSALARSNGLPRRRVAEVLAEVGLTEAAGRRVGSFSLGMRQRLGIATALLGDPPVLIFDEPVNGLDPEGVRWLRHLLRTLAAQGRTVLVSSHLMSEMANTVDHIVVIGRGRLLAAESLHDFEARNSPLSVTVRTADPGGLGAVLIAEGAATRTEDAETLIVTGMNAARIGSLAFDHGFPLHEITTHARSLEDAFMQLTADSVDYQAGGSR